MKVSLHESPARPTTNIFGHIQKFAGSDFKMKVSLHESPARPTTNIFGHIQKFAGNLGE